MKVPSAAGPSSPEVSQFQRNPQHSMPDGPNQQSPRGDQPPAEEELRGTILNYGSILEMGPDEDWEGEGLTFLSKALSQSQAGRMRQARDT